MATNYNIDYEDERFQSVESDKQNALNEVNSTYDNMINQSDQYYQAQIDATNKYAEEQKQNQQANTDFLVEQINQQKGQAEKDYTKEQKGAYADWQKQSNVYGANAEQMAANGLANTGYSESSQVSMYNTYQNRVATARESFNKAILNYDNSIKEAQLANNSALAEIAYNALKTQLELSLQGFQYKNTLLQTQLEMKQQTEDRYYSRWQDVLNQMNTENQFAESVRQFEQNYQMQVKQFEENVRQFNEEIARLKKKDEQEYQMEIQRLEMARDEAIREANQWAAEYELKKQQNAQAQANWEKEYALSKQAYTSGGSGGGGGYTYTSSTKTSKDAYGNSPSTQNKKDYYFSNGYQPQYVNDTKLKASGLKVWNVFSEGTSDKNATSFGKQNIWQAGGKYYVWDGKIKDYVDVTKKVQDSQTRKVNFEWGR